MSDNILSFEKTLPSPVRKDYECLLLKLEETKEKYQDGDEWFTEVFNTLPDHVKSALKQERTVYALIEDTLPLLHQLIHITLNTHENPLSVILTDGECFNNSNYEETLYDAPMIGVSNYLLNPSSVGVAVKRHTFEGSISPDVKLEKRVGAINSNITNLKIKQNKLQNEYGVPVRIINALVQTILDFLVPRNAEIKINDDSNDFTLSATYITGDFGTYSTIDNLILSINKDIFEVIVE